MLQYCMEKGQQMAAVVHRHLFDRVNSRTAEDTLQGPEDCKLVKRCCMKEEEDSPLLGSCMRD